MATTPIGEAPEMTNLERSQHNQILMLMDALGGLLIHVGMLRPDVESISGPELIQAATDFCRVPPNDEDALTVATLALLGKAPDYFEKFPETAKIDFFCTRELHFSRWKALMAQALNAVGYSLRRKVEIGDLRVGAPVAREDGRYYVPVERVEHTPSDAGVVLRVTTDAFPGPMPLRVRTAQRFAEDLVARWNAGRKAG